MLFDGAAVLVWILWALAWVWGNHWIFSTDAISGPMVGLTSLQLGISRRAVSLAGQPSCSTLVGVMVVMVGVSGQDDCWKALGGVDEGLEAGWWDGRTSWF